MLPEGWSPSQELLAWAAQNHRGVDTARETEKFINHWRSTGTRRLDWDATWRNWILKAEEISPAVKATGAKTKMQQAFEEARRQDGLL